MRTRGTKRLRGAILRLVRARWPAVLIGTVLITAAVVTYVRDDPWESGWTDGMGLVCGATGAALLLSVLAGHRPDWIDSD